MRRRGLGQTLPDISGLPIPGNLASQLAQGTNIFNTSVAALTTGDSNAVSSLLQAGVTIASGTNGGSTLGTIVRDVATIGGAALAGSVGGPFGAVAGAVVGTIEVLVQSIFGGGPDLVSYSAGEPTVGTKRIYTLFYQWCQEGGHKGSESGNPLGWTLYDYLSRAFPPNTTGGGTIDLWENVWDFAVANGVNGYALYNDPALASVLRSPGASRSGPVTAAQYVRVAQPLCTPAIWNWATPASITDCNRYEWFYSPDPTLDALYNLWQTDSLPIVSPTTGQIVMPVSTVMQNAILNRPSQMFFASSLYVLQAGPTGTLYGNLATLVGLATWLGIIGAGGGALAALNELLIQQKFLSDLDGVVPPLFRLLVEDALATAQREQARVAAAAAHASISVAGTATPYVVPQSPYLPTGASAVGAVLLGVAGAAVTGLVGYSAATGRAPKEILKSLGSRAKVRLR